MAGGLIPVIILFTFVGILSWIGYQIYLYTQTLTERGQKSMAKRNISFTKDGGMRVGVKEVSTEKYADKTQKWLVKAWNLSEWPAYRSMFWNKDAKDDKKAQRPKLGEKTSSFSTGNQAQPTASPNPRPQAVHSYTR